MTLLRSSTAILATLLAAALPARAQQHALRDSLLERMTGRWVLKGTIAGQATTHDVRAEWVLGHEYVRLTEVSRERDAGGAPAYQAIVFVGTDPARPGYAFLWLDNTGEGGLLGQAIAHAEPARGDSISFVYAVGGEPPFHTTFVYRRAGDAWEWHMDAERKDGSRKPFARVTLTRAR